MKRIVFFLIIICTSHVFANTEMDFLSSCSVAWLQFENENELSGGYLKAPSAEMNITFFFVPLGRSGEAGIAVSGGYGEEIWLGSSVAFRYTCNETNSFSLSAGVKTNYMEVHNSDFNFGALSLSLSHKHWLVSTDGFHFGIMVGGGVDVPFWGKREYTSYYAYTRTENGYVYADWDDEWETRDLERGVIPRFFVGICMNLGDRAIDRHRKD